jgi:hypothetical protein
MMIPGRALHRIAARICCPKTLERVVEPAIADLQKEYTEAAAGGATKRVWTLVRGYLAILEVTVMCAFGVSAATDDDRRAIVRTIAWTFALTAMFVAFLMLPPMIIVDESFSNVFLVGLVPQAVPLAIPLGLTFGIAFGMTRRTPTGAVMRAILACAVLASLVSFATLGWVMPAANQAWRESVARTRGISGSLAKGAAEMTFSELDREVAIAASSGDAMTAGSYAWSFHVRFALATASIVLAGFLFATATRNAASRALVALFACFSYWALLYVGQGLAGTIPAAAGAWLPNIVLGAAALLIAASRSSRLRGSLTAAP